MSTIRQRAYYVHDILAVYIAIHNDLFKPSLRRLLPIPRFFVEVDFNEYRNALDELSGNLEHIILESVDGDEYAITIREYATALLRTMQTLREICDKLDRKSDGDATVYSKREYKRDFRKYLANVREYKAVGERLNEYL